jgi:hypothetical protein
LPDAEILLLDGCINDVGASKIALPFPFNFTTKETIAKDAATCGPEMNALLENVVKQFNVATIVVINYYRIVSPDSTVFLKGRVGGPQPVAEKGSAPDKVDRLSQEQQKLIYMSGSRVEDMSLTRGQVAPQNKETSFQRWNTNAEAFLSTSETCFDWAIAGVDGSAIGSWSLECTPLFPPPNHPGAAPYLSIATADSRVFLATVPDNPKYAYGAPDTHLWHLPVKFLFWTSADHMYGVRKKLCKKYFSDAFAQYKCTINPIAHPNVKGAQFYRDSLVRVFKTAWAVPPARCPSSQIAENSP